LEGTFRFADDPTLWGPYPDEARMKKIEYKK